MSEFQDTAKDYRSTFTACATVAEWIAGNMAHGNRLANNEMAIANFCGQLGVRSALCDAAGG